MTQKLAKTGGFVDTAHLTSPGFTAQRGLTRATSEKTRKVALLYDGDQE